MIMHYIVKSSKKHKLLFAKETMSAKMHPALWLFLMLLNAFGVRAEEASIRTLSLDECIDIALKKNRLRAVTQLEIDIAEAQLEQALSIRWPQLGLSSSLSRRDRDPLFVFPSFTDVYQFNFLGQPLESEVSVPEQRVKLQDRVHFTGAVDALYPLYLGGKRSALARQGKGGVKAARHAARRGGLEITRDVRRLYYGAVFARQLAAIGRDALESLEVVLSLTESLYQRSSGKVKKTDYLQLKIVVESLRALVLRLESNEHLTRVGLAGAMGLGWQEEVEPAAQLIPFTPYQMELTEVVDQTYRSNPDWGQLAAGLDVFSARIDESRSDRLPRVALLANLQLIVNAHNAGIVSSGEKRSFLVAIGVELPLFDGFLTRGRIREARARLQQLQEQQVRLSQGLALQVKALFLQADRAAKQHAATRAALEAAEAHADLVGRAFRAEMMEAEDVAKAQALQMLAEVQHLQVLYEHATLQGELEFVVGAELRQVIGEGD